LQHTSKKASSISTAALPYLASWMLPTSSAVSQYSLLQWHPSVARGDIVISWAVTVAPTLDKVCSLNVLDFSDGAAAAADCLLTIHTVTVSALTYGTSKADCIGPMVSSHFTNLKRNHHLLRGYSAGTA
jgi:hypothetical protein